MSQIYHIRKLSEQRITFNAPVIYSTSIEYVTKGNIDKHKEQGYVSRNKLDAWNFTSLEKAVNTMLELRSKRAYDKDDWQVVGYSDIATNSGFNIIDEDTVEFYERKRDIDKYEKEVERLTTLINSLKEGRVDNRVILKDLEIGLHLFIVKVKDNGTYLGTDEVIVTSDIKELDYDIKAVAVDFVKPPTLYLDEKVYLSDVGIIKNNYNKSRTFRTKEDADNYAMQFK